MQIVLGGVGVILFTRMFLPDLALPAIALTILVALAYHLYSYERGRNQAALDFGVTVGALVYIGWIGAYLFDLRNLP